MAEAVLQLRNLNKSFGALAVTDDVSLTLVPGLNNVRSSAARSWALAWTRKGGAVSPR